MGTAHFYTSRTLHTQTERKKSYLFFIHIVGFLKRAVHNGSKKEEDLF